MTKRSELDQLAKILGGILIWRCARHGNAARAGVQDGDIVLGVNGVRTNTIEEFRRARRLRAQGATLLLFRQGRELTVEVPFETATSLRGGTGDRALSQLDRPESSWALTGMWSNRSLSN